MANFCPHCGASVADVVGDRCPACDGKLRGQRRRGLLGRIIERLFTPTYGRIPLDSSTTTVITERQEYHIQDSETGEVKFYQNLDKLPPEIRQRVERLRQAAREGGGSTEYRFKDSSGEEQVYHSLDEMPPDIRERFERFRRGR